MGGEGKDDGEWPNMISFVILGDQSPPLRNRVKVMSCSSGRRCRCREGARVRHESLS